MMDLATCLKVSASYGLPSSEYHRKLVANLLLHHVVGVAIQQQQDIVLLERVQRRATKWILSDFHSDYKSRLSALNLLPLMMTLELYDLSFFLKSFHSPTPNFNIMDFISFRSGSTRSSSLRKMRIPFNPSNRSRHFYFSRLPRLWNSLPLPTLDPSSSVSSNFLLIKSTFMDKFTSTFDPSQPCTFHFYCPCGKCFISSHHSYSY